jgi:hypothetical protein
MRHSFRLWVLGGIVPLVVLAGCSSRRLDLSKPSAQMNFGVKAAQMDLWREARFRFERAVELNPNDAQALNNLAVAYEGSGDFEKARETYLRALKIDQSNQYIQKNYSRFMEFHQRNRKRESADPVSTRSAAARPAAPPAEGESAAPADAGAPSDQAPEQEPVPAAPPSGPKPPSVVPQPAEPAVPAATPSDPEPSPSAQPPGSEGATR